MADGVSTRKAGRKGAKRKSSKVKKVTAPIAVIAKPFGRPSKYKPRFCADVVAFMLKGGEKITRSVVAGTEVVEIEEGQLPGFFEDFAQSIDVHVDTLHEWCDKHPDFSEAYKKAKQVQLSTMLRMGLKGAYPAAPYIFALKNMHGWRDKQEVEHTGRVEADLSPETLEMLSNRWDRLSLRQPLPGNGHGRLP